MNPGVLLNELFWTAELPDTSFRVSGGGTRAVLSAQGVPLCNTIVFAGDRAIPASVDIEVEWQATSAPVRRGFGSTVPPDDFGAFLGRFADARATARVAGRQLGFSFESGPLDSDAFYAEMGRERNGVFL